MASENMYCGSKRKFDEQKYSGAYLMPEVRDMARELGISLTTKKRKDGKKTVKAHSKGKTALCREVRACSRGHCPGTRPTWTSSKVYSAAKARPSYPWIGKPVPGGAFFSETPNDYNIGRQTAPLGLSTPTLADGAINPAIWNLAPTPSNAYNNFGINTLLGNTPSGGLSATYTNGVGWR